MIRERLLEVFVCALVRMFLTNIFGNVLWTFGVLFRNTLSLFRKNKIGILVLLPDMEFFFHFVYFC